MSNKRLSYYVSRKNFLVWLSALTMACSVILRIAYFCKKGADTTTVWFLIVLPVIACLMFVLTILLGGKEHLYRTAIPVFLLAIYFGVRTSMSDMEGRFIFLCWIAYFAFAVVYLVILSGKPHAWFLGLMYLAALAGLGYEFTLARAEGQADALMSVLPDGLMVLGGLLTVLAMKVYLDNQYHPTWGDRADGRKLRTLDPIQIVGNYIMPNRNGASNNIHETVEITNLERYIREKRKQGMTNFGFTHVFLAGYVRVVAKYPALNRFLAGQQVYSRDEDIVFCMTIKEEMTTTGGESCIKLHLNPRDTVETIYQKLNDEVTKVKAPTEASDFDKTAKVLSMIPGLVFKFTVWLLKTMDYFGLLPKFLLEVSPFHGSIFFTSMGSLGIPPIVHHLYDFGNLPVFVAFGCKYRKNEVDAEGNIIQRKYMDYTVNTDERICDGFYYATVLKYMKKFLTHPERLDLPVEEVVRDID